MHVATYPRVNSIPPFPDSITTPNRLTNLSTTPGLRLKVSSKHLTLASKPFKNKLHSITSKHRIIQSDGRTHISLAAGFDPKAVTISLNIIHGRGSKVPKSVDLETLAKIAHFVDKFQLFETVEIYADRWIRNLWEETALEDADQWGIVSWIYVSYVFRRGDIFKAATRAAAIHADGPIGGLGLPVREKIISEFHVTDWG